LLEEIRDGYGRVKWRVREQFDLDRELTKSCRVGVDFSAKISGANAVARALTDGDLALAQIATLLLRFPDPPVSTNGEMGIDESIELVRHIHACKLLKFDWDPAKHPRWPAGSPDSVGGQFAPVDGAATVIPDTARHPGAGPTSIAFRNCSATSFTQLSAKSPTKSVPRQARVREGDARMYCQQLKDRGLLGRGDYRWMGKTIAQCVMGQVSEAWRQSNRMMILSKLERRP
jgi:hypothetical protein